MSEYQIKFTNPLEQQRSNGGTTHICQHCKEIEDGYNADADILLDLDGPL